MFPFARILFLVLIALFPQLLFSDSGISLHVGGSTYCDEDGCFGPTGIAYGGAFVYSVNETWWVDIDASLACTWEDLPQRLDDNGILFIPERERTRFWTGVSGVHKWNLSARSRFYAGAGIIAGHEWQKVIPKSGGTYSRKSESGWKFGISTHAGYQIRLSNTWGVAPEVRFYLMPDDLSAVRYSAVLSANF